MSTMTSVCTGLAVLAAATGAGTVTNSFAQRPRPYRAGSALRPVRPPRLPVRTLTRYGLASLELPVRLGDDDTLLIDDDRARSAGRSLRRLLWQPLAIRVAARAAVHAGQTEPVNVLLRLTDGTGGRAQRACELLTAELARYPGLATGYQRGRIRPGPVTVLLTGDQWGAELVAGLDERLLFLDGTFADLGAGGPDPRLMPMVSEDWSWRFSWDASEGLPPEERQLLATLVAAAHREGRQVRLTGGPTAWRAYPAYWRELWSAGVDLIGTTHSARLLRFLRRAPTRTALPPGWGLRLPALPTGPAARRSALAAGAAPGTSAVAVRSAPARAGSAGDADPQAPAGSAGDADPPAAWLPRGPGRAPLPPPWWRLRAGRGGGGAGRHVGLPGRGGRRRSRLAGVPDSPAGQPAADAP
jgi:hypothetical protein